ncbi:MAG TPA: tripartite tricarboxylate transporter substrate binding protein, partial [Bacillota bacterium]|nr:tripartite tricarboxylate transporter substrate binding protein [Bacillota bacterium]
MKRTINFCLVVLLCSVILLPAFTSAAEPFPNKPVEFIVPWSAGGGVDVLMRAIGSVFPKYANGQQLIIKNVPGGGAVMGFNEAMNAKPDGYTLTSGTTPMITKIHMTKVAFSVDSFKPVMMFADIPCYIMVPVDSPFKDLKDYIAYAKKNPGKITLGNGGAGGGTHLVGLAFQKFAKITLNNIPFEGGGPAFTALMGKHIDSAIGSSPEGIAQASGGQLRILGVFADQRLAKFPNVPTAAEQGVKFYGTMWRGIIAPKGTPDAIIQKYDAIFKQC